LRGSRAQADEDLRSDHPQFGIKPRAARLDFRIARLLMNAPLAPFGRRPLEMFHQIRYVYFCAVDASLSQRLIQESSRWPDKGMSRPVLLISGLLSDEHDLSLRS